MSVRVLGVGMGDWVQMGRDTFLVQDSPATVQIVEVHRDGACEAHSPEPLPAEMAGVAIECYGAFYPVRGEVTVERLAALAALGGRFAFAEDGTGEVVLGPEPI